jgi:hypothetical protein
MANIREVLFQLPVNHYFEIPGFPNAVYELRDYTQDKKAGRAKARADLPFLFRAFETGQAPPPRPGTKKAEAPRAATIHEYLDWTVTSEGADQDLVSMIWCVFDFFVVSLREST